MMILKDYFIKKSLYQSLRKSCPGNKLYSFPFILTLQGVEAAYFQTPSLYTNITSVTVNELISTCGVRNNVPSPKKKIQSSPCLFPHNA